jgi:NADH-quinone oxidoreductase subunit A
MILHTYAIVALAGLAALGFALLGAALWRPAGQVLEAPDSWKQYRFGFATYALIFLAFDMEMIFMYPWAVVFARIGVKAFLDMLVFIALLGGGIAYAWGMGGLKWE